MKLIKFGLLSFYLVTVMTPLDITPNLQSSAQRVLPSSLPKKQKSDTRSEYQNSTKKTEVVKQFHMVRVVRVLFFLFRI